MPEVERISRDQFIREYCERSEITWDELQEYQFCAPCNCDFEECQGWCMVPSNEYSLSDYRPGGIYHDPERWTEEYAPAVMSPFARKSS